MGKRLAKKVLVIGWDAADWKVINPLLDAGKMPALEKLVNNGVMGKIATMNPPLSPILWTSIATGKRPYKHGILGFTEPDNNGKGIRPVLSTSRKVKAIWNILSQHKLRSHVIGWWPSHPAEPINGIMVSNFYQKATGKIEEEWPMTPGTVHPKEKEDLFANFRIHPAELTGGHILPFVPKAKEVDQEKDQSIQAIANILAHCSSIHAAATYILEHEEWDFLAVYQDAIDHFSHGFMKYHPPKQGHVPDNLYDLYHQVVESAYIYHDMMLERLIELAGPDTTIILLSDHGFHPDHLRLKGIPKEPAGPAHEHSPFGIFCMSGPGIKKDEIVYGTSILDIMPTILTLFGLPIAEDLDGKVVVNAFEEDIKTDRIPSWDDIPGPSGMHPKDLKEDPYAAQAVLDQLVELGYIEKPSEDIDKAVRKTVRESKFYLAQAYIDGNKYLEAIPILEEIFSESKEVRYSMALINCYQKINDNVKYRETLEEVKKIAGDKSPVINILEASLLINENKPIQALAALKKAEEKDPDKEHLHLQLGRCYISLVQWPEAEKAFEQALKINSENASAYHGLGVSLLRQKRYEEAVEALLNSIALVYYFPFAHYHLGEALFNLNKFEEAEHAFKVCLQIAPQINKAREWLIKLYKGPIENEAELNKIRNQYQKEFIGEITIVSGLPRSGTSMMMQMLEKGGSTLFTDNKRIADENNPKGYLEHEAVKAIKSDKTWLKDAMGKVVKVVSPLLMELPSRYKYKIIFMERDIHEILASQKNMLVREGKAKKDTASLSILDHYEKHLETIKKWAKDQQNVNIYYASHQEALKNPSLFSKKISDFLKIDLDTSAMAGVVDKNLYRENFTQKTK